MVAYRRKDRPNEGYRIWPSLPEPWGRVGPWQTGLRSKRQADQVEAWIKEMALLRPDLIDALVAGRFSLRAAWIAKLRGTLDELLAGVNDPPLADAVAEYRPLCKDERARAGLDQLLEYAEPGARLSWLRRKNIAAVYARAPGDGRKPNSVKRSLHRAVSELLLFHLGEEGRRKAFEGVRVPSERDEREVHLTREQIRTPVGKCQPEDFRWLVVAAIATAVDQGPLLAMTVRRFREAEATAAIPDTKTPDRPRILRLSDAALLAFRMAARGKGPDERLWPYTRWQVRKMWEAARRKAGLPDLRFKDLRHLLPTFLASLGVDRREIQAVLGHAPGSEMTDRYITPIGDVRWLNAAVAEMGLEGINVRAVGE